MKLGLENKLLFRYLLVLGLLGTVTMAIAHQPNDLCGVDPVACTYGIRNLKKAEPATTEPSSASQANAVVRTDITPTKKETNTSDKKSKPEKSISEKFDAEDSSSNEEPPSTAPAQETMNMVPYPMLELIPPLYPEASTTESASNSADISSDEVLPERSAWDTAKLYLKLGFQHILPLGIDHILFVLALFLASTKIKPLLIQVTAFTVAHTLTLGLAMLGWVTLPSAIVEPLIALSIAFVAIENYFFKEMTAWRPFVVFGFGLFHGLGFASVLTELGLPDNQFINALLSFNVGVELGQLSVIVMALLPALMLRKILQMKKAEHLYRSIVVIPFSIAIAAIGLFWAFQRVFLEG